jgi:hypothetical protein
MHEQQLQDRNYIKYLEDQNNKLRHNLLMLWILVYGFFLTIMAMLFVLVLG